MEYGLLPLWLVVLSNLETPVEKGHNLGSLPNRMRERLLGFLV